MNLKIIKKLVILLYYSIQILFFYLIKDFDLIYQAIYELILLLGPIFIKFGQWVSNRTDILPNQLCNLLKLLQDNCKNHKWKYTQQIIKNLPNEISDNLQINQKIIGSGCIAQVYQGEYHTKSVAIKVVHPNIEQDTYDSTILLKYIVTHLTLIPDIRKINKSIRFDSFFNLIRYQSNLENEAKYINQFTNTFNTKNNNLFIIPTLYYYNPNIIIESYENGLSLDEVKLKYPDKIHESLAKLWKIYHKMIQHNLIHGDFHPGNIKFRINPILNENIPILLDYGIVSSLDDKRHQLLKESFEYICFPNVEKILDLLLLSNIAKISIEKENYFRKYSMEYFKKMGVYDIYQNVKKHGLVFGISKENLDKYNRDPKIISAFLDIIDKSDIIVDIDFMNILLGISLLENYNNVYGSGNIVNVIKQIFI